MDKIALKAIYDGVRNFLTDNGYKRVYFDFKSYDCEEDIPKLTYKGKIYKVAEVLMGEDEIAFWTGKSDEVFIVKIDILDENELYTLLQDIYYEINESYTIGDFEDDFIRLLKVKIN